MLKNTLWTVMVFGALSSCSKDDDSIDANNQLSKEVKATQDAFKSEPGKQTPSPITPWATPGAVTVWDNNNVLMTALWAPPGFGPSFPDYSFHQLAYDFSPYYVNGEEEYNPDNYDLMAHFGYFSPEDVDNAVVEFTFQNIEYFLPHMLVSDPSGQDTRREFTVKYVGNQTVITCVTDLKQAYWNSATPSKRIGSPMFCFLLKINCNGNNNTTFWTDMKVNGESVKGTIQNKVFDCNKVTTAHSWTDSYTEANETDEHRFELWCDDTFIDILYGDVKVHCLMQYEGDELLFMNMTFDGSFVGKNTREVFKFKQIQKYDASSKKFYQDHFNVVGDMGSHLKFSFTVMTEEPWFAINKAECGE